jgi:hypothetical protein
LRERKKKNKEKNFLEKKEGRRRERWNDTFLASIKTDKAFNVDHVRVCKILGAGVLSTTVVRGMVFHRESSSTITTARDAKA